MNAMTRSSPVVVLKFGSSVLRTADDLPRAVLDLYAHLRNGERVVAVVSAFAGTTDRILSRCRRGTEQPDPAALAAAVSTGEIEAATQLRFALGRSGVPAEYLDPRDVGLLTRGPYLDAVPVGLDVERLRQALARVPVIILPGFFGIAERGGTALLGRGGSDLTAVYLAERLEARCCLVKDVDGLYEADPSIAAAPPRRFQRANYADALKLGNELIQPKAIEWVQRARRRVEIRAIGARQGTTVGPEHSVRVSSIPKRPVRVFLLGLGTVGGAVHDMLKQQPERYEIVGALVREPRRHNARGISPHVLETEAARAATKISDDGVDVVIEALGGTEPAHRLCLAALSAGRHVVTANKELVASHWTSLAGFIRADRPRLHCSASVGGAVPMCEGIKALRGAGRSIRSLRAVLNGTCNFILDQMANGRSCDSAVKEAQALGFAEPDPTADVSGLDAARKLEILSHLAFDAPPVRLEVTGLDAEPDVTSRPGFVRRQVARLEQDGTGRVGVEWLPESEFLSEAQGAENRLEVILDDGSVYRLSGQGAGGVPTATAILADLQEAARSLWENAHEGHHSKSSLSVATCT